MPAHAHTFSAIEEVQCVIKAYTQLCFRTSSLGEDNFYADISSFFFFSYIFMSFESVTPVATNFNLLMSV